MCKIISFAVINYQMIMIEQKKRSITYVKTVMAFYQLRLVPHGIPFCADYCKETMIESNWDSNRTPRHSILMCLHPLPPICGLFTQFIMLASSSGNISLRYWSFVRGNHRSPLNSPHKGQWSGALMFSFISAWTNGWVNNRDPGDLRHDHAYHDVTVMIKLNLPWVNAVLAY